MQPITLDDLDRVLTGIEFESTFAVKPAVEMCDEDTKGTTVNCTVKVDGITLRDVLGLASKPRIIARQNGMRRENKSVADFDRKVQTFIDSGAVIDLRPGTRTAAAAITEESAIQYLITQVNSGDMTMDELRAKMDLLTADES